MDGKGLTALAPYAVYGNHKPTRSLGINKEKSIV